jgi:hypothetical protein
MIAIPIGLIAGVAIATMAYKGIGTRPLYLAAMLVALVGAAGCGMLIPSGELLRTAPESSREGLQLMFDNGPPVVIGLLAIAFGCLLALILYRRPAQPAS